MQRIEWIFSHSKHHRSDFATVLLKCLRQICDLNAISFITTNVNRLFFLICSHFCLFCCWIKEMQVKWRCQLPTKWHAHAHSIRRNKHFHSISRILWKHLLLRRSFEWNMISNCTSLSLTWNFFLISIQFYFLFCILQFCIS